MYTSFTIENFRLFNRLTVAPLARVNLIAGDNNVGKTALLEALWVHAHPTNPRRAAAMGARSGLTVSQHTELLSDWFLQYKTSLPIRLEAAVNTGNGSRILEINRREREYQGKLSIPETDDSDFHEETTSDLDFDHELTFEYVNETGDNYVSSIWLDEEATPSRLRPFMSVKRDVRHSRIRSSMEVNREPNSPDRIRCEFVGTHSKHRPTRFSRIERGGYLPEIEEIIRQIEPRLQRLTLLTNERGIPSIYGDIGIGTLLPMSLMGDGVNRLLDFVLAFFPVQDGIILIDEIENGIHHKRLENVWKSLEWLSREFNVQVFATTHSYECIKAARTAFKLSEFDDEISYARLQRNLKTQRLECVAYDDAEVFDYALKYGREVR